ncbi:MAG: hypothetical protein ABL912_08530 [Novosphingobium sp.]
MADQSPIADQWKTAASTYSTTREMILEHRFLADLTSTLWSDGIFDFSVSHSEVDNSGYDVIIEAGSVTRHIQLKGMQAGGKRSDFDLQLRLQDKPSACAVVLIHDPKTLAIEEYRLFAGAPGDPIPALGEKIAKHSKGDSDGYKAQRPSLRNVPLSRFVPVADIAVLAGLLFGQVD